VESQSKNHARKEEITQFMSAESTEEEVERKSQKKRSHDGSKADAGKIDRPVGPGQHEGSE
jgi:hypothetical protein